jgi:glycosidase
MLEAFSTGIETGSAKPVRAVLETQGEAALGMARFLSSHDLSRLPNRVADPEARRALKVAQLLLPGAPVLYYGEELDLPDSTLGTGQDFNMRAAMPWDTGLWAGFSTGTPWFPPEQGFGRSVAEEALDPDSMLVLVQTLSCLRSKVAGGTFRLVEDEPEVLAFAWDVGEEWLEARVNFSGRAVDGLVAYGYLVEHSGLECSELH